MARRDVAINPTLSPRVNFAELLEAMLMPEISIARNTNRDGTVDTSAYSFANTEKIRRLHRSLNAYNVTSLVASSTEVFDRD